MDPTGEFHSVISLCFVLDIMVVKFIKCILLLMRSDIMLDLMLAAVSY